MLVVDAVFVVAALVDGGREGTWADGLLAGEALAAPHLMPVEVANILRRAVASGELTGDAASLAHADLLALRIDLFPYGPFESRVGSYAKTSPATMRGTSHWRRSSMHRSRRSTCDSAVPRGRAAGCRFHRRDE